MTQFGRLILRLLAGRNRRRLISLREVALARRFSWGGDSLLPSADRVRSTSSKIRNPELQQVLAGRELGAWALGAQTINWLEESILDSPPKLILEFGSGASTVCLATFALEALGPEAVIRVVSIDQNPDFAEETRELLRNAGLTDYVRILTAPLQEQEIDGIRTTCYQMPSMLSDVLCGRLADMVVIDGPAAEDGARFGTLPLARPYVSKSARFVLDDAFRDGEIWIANRWEKLAWIEVDGFLNIDKGLLVGQLKDA